MILLLITIILFILYSVLIIYYWQSWEAIPDFSTTGKRSQTKISVIIPARNEKENIEKLLQALQQQTYPGELFEVIVVMVVTTDEGEGDVVVSVDALVNTCCELVLFSELLITFESELQFKS